ncbi:Hypothetical protein SRAE_1000236900 [Strongyloides ratti]|uniref:Uncharacterized protein n=1 Tax=Strongyloides ratti TaxID=34506 RepID=A0A090MWQ9_STRRB|nr:Hypothetical protein SRAE_1000236900 [Strongyloides ratti]CEF64114.1 Hypothetical protein SRAE_1000236900 [Strongyloides ratti]
MIIVLVAVTTTCSAGGYQRPMEIEPQPNFEAPPQYGGYRKPYNNMPPEIPPQFPSKYNEPPVQSSYGTFNQPPVPSEGPFNSPPIPSDQQFNPQPPIDVGGNSYLPPNNGYINPEQMPYRSRGGYYRG